MAEDNSDTPWLQKRKNNFELMGVVPKIFMWAGVFGAVGAICYSFTCKTPQQQIVAWRLRTGSQSVAFLALMYTIWGPPGLAQKDDEKRQKRKELAIKMNQQNKSNKEKREGEVLNNRIEPTPTPTPNDV